ncbi:MAG: acetylornithine deacetylase [Gammaproteobacteria bacterium]|nr:acetylornithine deacetylase [Gammaproteobacteria bacterium]MDH5778077.1 acetylornithine deacetylase [Gammaproteobacteria bacterium]
MAIAAPPLLSMLQGLISTPSISSVNHEFDQSNLQVIELLANWLSDQGFQCEILPLKSNPHKANLIATIGSGPGGLVLAGHTDTVPYDEGRWQNDPFKLTEDSNRFYGLGTADMKSFLALAIEAARPFKADDFKQPLIILATADEESSMDGARELVQLGRPRARYAVVGEPTGLVPIRAHKGMMMESIRITGQSGHSSNPDYGNNALVGMYKVLGNLIEWQQELANNNINPLFDVPYPTLNLGHIHGGDNPNRICGQCELQIDLRPLPGMDIEELQHKLSNRIATTIENTGLSYEISHLMSGTPAMDTPIDSPLIRAAEKLTGHSAAAAAYSTEGPFLQQLGHDTMILGPGHIAQAHQPDEYIEQSMLNPAVKLLQDMISQFCLNN